MTLTQFFLLAGMCLYSQPEPSSQSKPRQSLQCPGSRLCATVRGYQKITNHYIICDCCYYQLPSKFMRYSYRYHFAHYTFDQLNSDYAKCYICAHILAILTPMHKCYLCYYLAPTLKSYKNLLPSF